MTAVRHHLRFYLGDELVEIAACDPTLTVLDWLRLDRRLTGTKEGCAEGDCGACTVVIGRLEGAKLRYEAINACIRFLPTLDGCQLLTVEHLKRADGALHPVQQAMVDHHGSQCGFCTPGFVMSLFALWLNGERPGVARLEDALAGNLCRCTGYEPIIKAGLAVADMPPAPDPTPIATRLARLSDDATLDLAGRFLAPTRTESLAELVGRHPGATMVAGATDVGLWVTKGLKRLDPVISLGRIASLREIDETDDTIRFGAMANHIAVREKLAQLSPQLDELMRRFGGEQIRNAGTIGGNIANGSPIGDLPPALIALGAELVLTRRSPSSPPPQEPPQAAAPVPQDAGFDGLTRRTIPLEDFFLDYRKQDRRPGEFVEAIVVPKPPDDALIHVSKITKRFDEDISAVCGAFLMRRDASGIVVEVRLAYGGMAGIPKRAAAAEAELIGRPFDEASASDAIAALPLDFTPLSDMRASSAYRLTVAGNLLRRFLIETARPGVATRVAGPLAEAIHG